MAYLVTIDYHTKGWQVMIPSSPLAHNRIQVLLNIIFTGTAHKQLYEKRSQDRRSVYYIIGVEYTEGFRRILESHLQGQPLNDFKFRDNSR